MTEPTQLDLEEEILRMELELGPDDPLPVLPPQLRDENRK